MRSCSHTSCLAWAVGTWRINEFHQETPFSGFLLHVCFFPCKTMKGYSMENSEPSERLNHLACERGPCAWDLEMSNGMTIDFWWHLYRKMREVGRTAVKSPCFETAFSLSMNLQVSRVSPRGVKLSISQNRGTFITHSRKSACLVGSAPFLTFFPGTCLRNSFGWRNRY